MEMGKVTLGFPHFGSAVTDLLNKIMTEDG